jgi:uncharacterized protein (DUF2147 family)
MIKLLNRTLIFVTVLWLVATAPAHAADPTGTWLTQQSDARIRISHCGKGICGTIVWLKEPIDRATGKPQVDDKNPNPAMRNRKIIGLRIFALQPGSSGKWTGKIYNADDGKSYDASVTVPGPAKLEVQGCAGPFCGSETWTRVGK